jgi:hypothetical protein
VARPHEPRVPTGRELELEREIAALRGRSWRHRLTR